VMKVKSLIYILATAGLLVIGLNCGGPDRESAKKEGNVIPVRVMKVERGNIVKTLDYLGDIKGLKEIKIYSVLSAKLLKINHDVGSFVKAGDTIGIVDNDRLKQMVEQAEAALKSAKAQYKNVLTEWERIKNLYENNAISKSQYDAVNAQKETAEAGARQAEANYKTALKQLKDSYLVSPINGIVSDRFYDVGDMCTPQMPVFTVVDMDTVKIEIQVPDNEVSLMKEGLEALISVDAYPDTMFKGSVYKVYPTINPATRTTTVEIRIPNKNHLLKPGMFARVKVIVEKRNNVLVIPRKAILERTELDLSSGEITTSRVKIDRYVFVVNGSVAHKRKIKTGIENDNFVEVTDGLKKGELLVVIGQQFVSDSSRVEIIE